MMNEEIEALNAKVDALYDIVVKQVLEPVHKGYEQKRWADFKNKHGDKLSPFNKLMGSGLGKPDYDFTKEVWTEFNNDNQGLDEDSFVEGMIGKANEYVSGLKEALGLSEDTAIEVKADKDGDGEPETVVVSEMDAPSEDSETKDDNTESTEGEQSDDEQVSGEEVPDNSETDSEPLTGEEENADANADANDAGKEEVKDEMDEFIKKLEMSL